MLAYSMAKARHHASYEERAERSDKDCKRREPRPGDPGFLVDASPLMEFCAEECAEAAAAGEPFPAQGEALVDKLIAEMGEE